MDATCSFRCIYFLFVVSLLICSIYVDSVPRATRFSSIPSTTSSNSVRNPNGGDSGTSYSGTSPSPSPATYLSNSYNGQSSSNNNGGYPVLGGLSGISQFPSLPSAASSPGRSINGPNYTSSSTGGNYPYNYNPATSTYGSTSPFGGSGRTATNPAYSPSGLQTVPPSLNGAYTNGGANGATPARFFTPGHSAGVSGYDRPINGATGGNGGLGTGGNTGFGRSNIEGVGGTGGSRSARFVALPASTDLANNEVGYRAPVAGFAAYSGSTGRRGGFAGSGASSTHPMMIPGLAPGADIFGNYSLTGDEGFAGLAPSYGETGLGAASDGTTTTASSAHVDDWMANLFNITTPSTTSVAEHDLIDDANVECDNASPFPENDFAAQNDDSKVYTEPATIPRDSPFFSVGFVKYLKVFGIIMLATADVGDTQLSHSAKILASYIDNDNDGIPDSEETLQSLVNLYKLVYGYIGGEDESNSFWQDRFKNSRNNMFKEQYACNIHFSEQWGSMVSPRYHTVALKSLLSSLTGGNSTSTTRAYNRCSLAYNIPFDWPTFYLAFTVGYYGYYDRVSNKTKAIINKAMKNALNADKFHGQYASDEEMLAVEFLIWSCLTNSGALECHCHTNDVSEYWKMCTPDDLYNFSPDWVKQIETFDFLPKKLPNAEYATKAVMPPLPQFSSPKENNFQTSFSEENSVLMNDTAALKTDQSGLTTTDLTANTSNQNIIEIKENEENIEMNYSADNGIIPSFFAGESERIRSDDMYDSAIDNSESVETVVEIPIILNNENIKNSEFFVSDTITTESLTSEHSDEHFEPLITRYVGGVLPN